jgi:hypothetical protein
MGLYVNLGASTSCLSLVFAPLFVWYELGLIRFQWPCGFCRCRFSHDIGAYLAAKPQDLRIPSTSEFTDTSPFGPDLSSVTKPHPRYPNVDAATQCPIFAEMGECRSVLLLPLIYRDPPSSLSPT